MEQNSRHRQQTAARLSVVGRRFFELIEFDDEEELILEIRKHSFGLFVIEFTGLLLSAFIAIAPIALAFTLDNIGIVDNESSLGAIQSGLIILGLVLGLLGIGATFISAMLYKSNVIFITNEKIAQVVYTSLFGRKISQLSIGDVQDVTVAQNGIFPRMFNYGTLVIETAGEQQNYRFTYVPEPYASSKAIVSAHEENLKLHGN